MFEVKEFALGAGSSQSVDREITFLGASSSGRMFEYAVSEAYKEELVKQGVTFSVHRPLSFYSPTHIHLAPKKGDKFAHEVAGFTNESGANVNFFKNIDKDAQKAFVEDLRDQGDIRRMAKAQANGLSEDALFKAELYRAKIQKIKREIALLKSEEDAMGA